eukprot:COSAG01_NODE_18258_length_1088_cov_2.437816_1_plen_45_part_01
MDMGDIFDDLGDVGNMELGDGSLLVLDAAAAADDDDHHDDAAAAA